ncbi:putative photosynthetic complex assembly protein PuhE [Pararhodobacter sp. SW119]|uniref:putative photosynthetic complex assembly protein PuhE n=1 Tax=Pararhodobacter sp. SW119 TaxID=2780075 RepID=UPI001AE08978|nr:putative photosynthetic complex assembly protein PuhE [Pararhodobacter sp. SW119]
MLETPWIAVLGALFLWWFCTGILLWRVHRADRGGPDDHIYSALLGLPLLAAGVLGVNATLGDASAQGVWLAFLSALALWGWIELAFLSGVITGPVRAPCPPELRGSARFWRAFGTIAWHEAVLVLTLAALIATAAGAANAFALWTFMVLFVARISAKLNLFFGVPRINLDFLPSPLAHLASYFRQGPVSGFFPFSVTLMALALGCFIERLWSAEAAGAQIGFTLLAALTALALLEHWFMVWRVRDDRLWRWLLPAPETTPTTRRLRKDSHGL